MGLVPLCKAVCTAEMFATEYRIIIIFFKAYVWISTYTSPVCQEKAVSYQCGASQILKPRIILSFSSIIKYSRVHWRQISQRKFDLFFKPWKWFGHSVLRFVTPIQQHILFWSGLHFCTLQCSFSCPCCTSITGFQNWSQCKDAWNTSPTYLTSFFCFVFVLFTFFWQ